MQLFAQTETESAHPSTKKCAGYKFHNPLESSNFLWNSTLLEVVWKCHASSAFYWPKPAWMKKYAKKASPITYSQFQVELFITFCLCFGLFDLAVFYLYGKVGNWVQLDAIESRNDFHLDVLCSNLRFWFFENFYSLVLFYVLIMLIQQLWYHI